MRPERSCTRSAADYSHASCSGRSVSSELAAKVTVVRRRRRRCAVQASSGTPGIRRVAEVARHLAATAAAGAELVASRRESCGPYMVRSALPTEFWELAHVHCATFYPSAGFLCAALLRLDRFLALQVGPKCEVPEWNAFYRSLVACSDNKTAKSSRAQPLPNRKGLLHWVQHWLPQQAQKTLMASSADGGLHVCGVITVDSLGQHIPTSLEVQTVEAAQMRRVTGMTCRGIAYISNLAVAEHVRRHGIGSALLRAAEATARDWGCLATALHCNPANAAAFEMYRRAGYRTVTVEPAWYSFLQGQSRLEVMTKSLVKARQ